MDMPKRCSVCGKEITDEYFYVLRVYEPDRMTGRIFCSRECLANYLVRLPPIERLRKKGKGVSKDGS